MLAVRIVATTLLGFCLIGGWVVWNYPAVAVPAILAAWAAAFFGDQVDDLTGIGIDGLARWLGLAFLAVFAFASAAAQWKWFA
jgi:hypothetical protein